MSHEIGRVSADRGTKPLPQFNTIRQKLSRAVSVALACREAFEVRSRAERWDPAVFVWIPKTGGTSLFQLLSRYGCQLYTDPRMARIFFRNRGVVSFGHLGLPDLIKVGIVKNEFATNAYKFCVVRNPYHRLVSLYEYLYGLGEPLAQVAFEDFIEAVITTEKGNIGLHNRLGLSQARPQTSWILDKNGKLVVDRIYRLEDGTDWSADLIERIFRKSPVALMGRENSSERRRKKYYNLYTAEKIYEHYYKDFEVLNYEKNSFGDL